MKLDPSGIKLNEFSISSITNSSNERLINSKLHLFPENDTLIRNTFLFMGYPDLNSVPTSIYELTSETVCEIKLHLNLKYIFKGENLESYSCDGFRTRRLEVKSKKWGHLSSLLLGRKHACCFALTLGKKLDAKIKEQGDHSVLRAFIWDSLCSLLVEHFADAAETFITDHFKEYGLPTTRRFSPGYCDWDLMQGQKQIFTFCRPEAIGVRFQEFGLMLPRKSMTGIVLSAEKVPYNLPCYFCRKDCRHRRMPYHRLIT
jgi:hypothetical protein